jgi:hypothetical protein
MAEFHWDAWADAGPADWFYKGRAFRTAMAGVGIDGSNPTETWSINEVHGGVRNDPDMRTKVEALVNGLYDKNVHPAAMAGSASFESTGSGSNGTVGYKNACKQLFLAEQFWGDVKAKLRHVTWQTYGAPADFAVAGSPLSRRRQRLQDYLFHPVRLLWDGPPRTKDAYGAHYKYAPAVNAYWDDPDGTSVYGTAGLDLGNMSKFVRLQVEAVRERAVTGPAYANEKIWLVWNESPERPAGETELLAGNVASAIESAFGPGAVTICASRTCDPVLPDAAFKAGWGPFGSW